MRLSDANRLGLAVALLTLGATAPASAATWSPAAEAVPAPTGGFGATVTLLAGDRVALGWGVAKQTSVAFAAGDAPFGAPVVTALTPPKAALAFGGAIARDGTAVVVYRARLRYMRARRILVRPDGTVSRPRSLSTDGHTADSPVVSFAPDGSAIAAWRRYDGTHWEVQVATMAPGGDFGPPRTIDVPGRHAQFVTVGAGPRGDGVVAWTTYPPRSRPAGSGATTHAQAARISAGRPGPPIDLGGAAAGQIRAATNGTTAAVAWSRNRAYEDQSVEVSRLAAGEPVHTTLVRGPGNTFGPAVGVDRAGAVTVAWAKYPSTAAGTSAPVQVATAPPDGDFAAPQVVSAAEESAVQLVLAERDDGAAVLVWQGNVPDGGGVTAVRAAVRGRSGEPFGAPAPLSPAGRSGILGAVDVAPDDRVAVTWSDVTTPGAPRQAIWLARGSLGG